MDQQSFEVIEKKVAALESEVRNAVNKDPRWDRKSETVMDRLVMLGTWLHDRTHGHECKPDPLNICSKYRNSMLRRVRKALRYEY